MLFYIYYCIIILSILIIFGGVFMVFKAKEIELAYLTFKELVYYENNVLLHLKMQLADFENKNNFTSEESRLSFFYTLENLLNNGDTFDSLINSLNFKKVIKKLNDNSKDLDILNIISPSDKNLLSEDKIQKINDILLADDTTLTLQYNYIIDCDITLHILSILWIFKVGYKFDKTVQRYSYGYRLNFTNDILDTKHPFKRYITQYQAWKNNGIKKAKEITLTDNENAVLISLDLKRFYYSISHEILKSKMESIFKNISDNYLTKIILNINKQYDLLVSEDMNENREKHILPIGLYSSHILANIYLKELDENILKLNPSYYGRYVDDLFIVFKEYDSKKFISKKNYLKEKLAPLIEKTFIDNIGLEKCFSQELLIENTKHKTIFLTNENKKVEILKIENSFLERASTFTFLPNEKNIEDLYRKIFSEKHEDTKSKKYDVSVYLAKILTIFSGINKNENISHIKKNTKDLLDFFGEENIIKYSVYFEKVFIFLVMIEDTKEIENFYKKINTYLSKLTQNETANKSYINYIHLKEYLNNSFFFALSLNPKLLKNFTFEFKSIFKDDDLQGTLFKIFNSNMLKQKMIHYPLLSYLPLTKEIYLNFNFFEARYFDFEKNPDNFENFNLCDQKLKLSPRFIHLDELNIFYIKRHILNHDKNFDYLDISKEKFTLNFKRKNQEKEIEVFKNNICDVEYNNLHLYKVKSNDKKELKEATIGIASLLIDDQKVFNVLDGNYNLSFNKKERIMDILNLSKKHNVNILIFPEVSIPFQWLKFINEFSRKNQILITGGLEHIHCPSIKYKDSCKKYAYNYLFTTLPFSTNNYKSSFIKIRLKNHYAPGEKDFIEGKNFSIPKPFPIKYDIFSWEGIHFSNFNCFELSDIEGRSKLKNYIDLLIASVFNRDLHYFKNILESTCRDLHVYVAQSNTSIYGDCEIMQPTKKESMILGCLKGGINDNLLVDKIDIQKLREFQLLNNTLQKSNNKFKVTPPGIDPDIVTVRNNNSLDLFFKENLSNPKIELLKELLSNNLLITNDFDKLSNSISKILKLDLKKTKDIIKRE